MEKLKLIERNFCAVTGAEDLEPLPSVKKLPVFSGCVKTPESEDISEEMFWTISKSSGVVQLKRLIPMEILY